MGWSVGYDENHKRDVGYGVPAYCDQPGCQAEIDRGLAHTCGGEPYGGSEGCGLHFCRTHLYFSPQVCEQCHQGGKPFEAKADHPEWMHWKLTDESWQQWREENPEEVAKLKATLANNPMCDGHR